MNVDLDEFRELARDRRVIPVSRKLLADGITAVGLFESLCADRAGTFLLESVEQGRNRSRFSFVGVRSSCMLVDRGGRAEWVGQVPIGATDGATVEALGAFVRLLRTTPLPGMPPLTGGLVGFITYDAVRHWERVPDENPDELNLPEVGFLLAADLAVLDHVDGSVLLIANAINYNATDENVDAAWRDAVDRLDAMESSLACAAAPAVATMDLLADPNPSEDGDAASYMDAVEQAKDRIRAGDAFQIVLSRRFRMPCPAPALDVYRALRATNPSPYLYLLRIPEGSDAPGRLSDRVSFDIVGSSPEALVTVRQGRCVVHPIAGTRRRGATAHEDAELAEDLLKDDKERAEHVMLVDLARNDLGRVCMPGSVGVVEFMEVERYSHVMHLVSTVAGVLAPEATALDALAATFPAGTLSGAPKPKAMEIIDELESIRRGLYGGAVGYLDFAGDLDMAIAIRTAVIKGAVAYVQAGAGIVADSSPRSEAEECANKAAAVLRAVAIAGTIRPVRR